MTIVILIVAGLMFGALMLGLGYVLGKKAKVKKQIQDVIDNFNAAAKGMVTTASEAAKDQVGKV